MPESPSAAQVKAARQAHIDANAELGHDVAQADDDEFDLSVVRMTMTHDGARVVRDLDLYELTQDDDKLAMKLTGYPVATWVDCQSWVGNLFLFFLAGRKAGARESWQAFSSQYPTLRTFVAAKFDAEGLDADELEAEAGADPLAPATRPELPSDG